MKRNVEFYRRKFLQEFDELLKRLTDIDVEPAKKEPTRRRIVLLQKGAARAKLGDRGLIESKIRDVERAIENLRGRRSPPRLPKPQPQPAADVDDRDRDVMTLRDVADHLNCHYSTVYRLVHAGGLPAFRLGGEFRLRRADLEKWIAAGGGTPSRSGAKADSGAGVKRRPRS